jgi:hypothetical protein
MTNNRLLSLLLNVQDFMVGKEENLFRNRYFSMIPEKRIASLNIIQTFLNNNYFTPRQLFLYILYNSIFDSKFHTKINSWDFKHIDEISKLFTRKRLDQDIGLINGLIGKSGVKNLLDTVILNSSGEMIALELMKAKYISPIFVIRFKDEIVRKSEPSEETVRMLRIVDAIERVLKTELI